MTKTESFSWAHPKAKEIADVVEDVKIRSEVVDNTAHCPAHSLYHSSIVAGSNQRISMRMIPGYYKV